MRGQQERSGSLFSYVSIEERIPGLIQSVSQARWSELPALGSLSELAPSLCAKPALLQPI